MKKEENKVNKKIKVEEDLTAILALSVANKYLASIGADPFLINGFVYIVGPTVSDLVVVEQAKKKMKEGSYKVRSCTNEEWNKYFYTHIIQ